MRRLLSPHTVQLLHGECLNVDDHRELKLFGARARLRVVIIAGAEALLRKSRAESWETPIVGAIGLFVYGALS